MDKKTKYTQRRWDRIVGHGKVPPEYAMEENEVVYEISDSLVEELQEIGIDAISEIEQAIQDDLDEHDEEAKIVRKESS